MGKVFKNGTSKICRRQPLKNLKWYGLLQLYKVCLPQILLGPFLNTLSQLCFLVIWFVKMLPFMNSFYEFPSKLYKIVIVILSSGFQLAFNGICNAMYSCALSITIVEFT